MIFMLLARAVLALLAYLKFTAGCKLLKVLHAALQIPFVHYLG